MKRSSAKQKGKQFEKTILQMIADWTGLPLEDFFRARGGTDECDIGLSTEARRRFNYWTECKNQRTLSIPAWIRQAEETCEKRGKAGQVPIVVFKQHGDSTPYVCLPFEVFLDLATRHLNEERNNGGEH